MLRASPLSGEISLSMSEVLQRGRRKAEMKWRLICASLWLDYPAKLGQLMIQGKKKSTSSINCAFRASR